MESPQCKICEHPMYEVGGIGKLYVDCDTASVPVSVSEIKLYQCPKCKTIKLC